MRKTVWLLSAALLLTVSQTVAQTVQQTSAAQSSPPQTRTTLEAGQGVRGDLPVRTTYALGPDDQMVIRVADVPDITDKPQRIDPNGDLRLPMIGRVHAAGMTVEALERELAKRLKVYLEEPDVSILVTEFRSQPVSVIGAVASSGVRQLEGRKTLIEMLSLAGGVTAEAGPTIRITRRVDVGPIPLAEATVDTAGGFSTVEIPAKPLMDGRTPAKNIIVQPYDVISVPRAETVYVVGEVGKPGAVPLSGGNSVSIMEAVASAGGVLRTAAPKKARVLRRSAGEEKRTELDVNLQKVMQGKAEDMRLAAGDILIVPDSSGKRAATRAIEAAIQAGTIVATYGIIR